MTELDDMIVELASHLTTEAYDAGYGAFHAQVQPAFIENITENWSEATIQHVYTDLLRSES